jgi:hypothetical protein
MHLDKPILFLAGALAFTSGCRSSDSETEVFHAWGWENAKEAKAHFDEYKHILVAEVYESHWEDRGAHKLTPYRFKGTVTKSFKGDWQVSEKIAFVHYVDSPAPTNKPSAQRNQLMFVFTNEHTNAEVAVDTGEFGIYDAESAPALELLFSCPNHR